MCLMLLNCNPLKWRTWQMKCGVCFTPQCALCVYLRPSGSPCAHDFIILSIICLPSSDPLGLSSSPFIFTSNALPDSSTPASWFPLYLQLSLLSTGPSEPLTGMFKRNLKFTCLTSYLLSHPAPSSLFYLITCITLLC